MLSCPKLNPEKCKKLGSGYYSDSYPEDEHWNVALTYMLLWLGNEISRVNTAINGSDLPGSWGKPWSLEKQKDAVKNLYELNKTFQKFADDIIDHYHPFTCS